MAKTLFLFFHSENTAVDRNENACRWRKDY